MFLIPKPWYTIKKTKKKGRGAFAAQDIPPGTIIGDYLGTIVRPEEDEDEKNGLYGMGGGDRYDIIADRRADGIHLINNSCANNCEMYPFQGHILYIALRKIFKGEELTVKYDLDAEGDTITADHRVCHCGSLLCRGTWYGNSSRTIDAWEKLKKKEFGRFYSKEKPGDYGASLLPLEKYPAAVSDHPELWDIFGAEHKPALSCRDKKLPAASELRRRIRKSGQQLAFRQLGFRVLAVQNGLLVVKR
jgi:hypothetical protein